MFCGSSSWCRGFVCSMWLWYFLVILTSFLCEYRIENVFLKITVCHHTAKNKWVWSGNTTITHCRPTHGKPRDVKRWSSEHFLFYPTLTLVMDSYSKLLLCFINCFVSILLYSCCNLRVRVWSSYLCGARFIQIFLAIKRVFANLWYSQDVEFISPTRQKCLSLF